jgi:hypothetical protein
MSLIALMPVEWSHDSKPHAEMQEGRDAFERFRKAVQTVIAVPKSALPPRPTRTKKKAVKRARLNGPSVPALLARALLLSSTN